MRRIPLSLILLTAFAFSAAAHADTIDDFVITGGGNLITFSAPATTETFELIGAGGVDGGYFVNAAGEFNGQPTTFDIQMLSPYLFTGPGISLHGLTLVGALLYGGPSGAHTFLTGTFTLKTFPDPTEPFNPTYTYTVTITPESSTVPTPEPSTLALLCTGVLGFISTRAMKQSWNL